MKGRSVLIRIFLLAVCLDAVCASCFAEDWPPIAPENLAMTSVPQQPGAPAVVLLREETDDDMNNVHSFYMRIKILTDAGLHYATVEVPYNRRAFTIDGVKGRTTQPDGSSTDFEGKPFDKVLVKGHGIRVQEKSFTLPNARVGSIVEYRYSLRYGDRMLLAPTWMVQDDLFQKKASFKFIPFQNHGSIQILLDHDQIANGESWTSFLPKQYQPQQHDSVHGVLSQAASSWVTLDINDIPAFVEEPYMPPADLLKWRVQFYYRVSGKPDEYWKTQGKFWNKDVNSFLGKDKGIWEAVQQTVAATDTPEQKVRKIYDFVAKLENQDYIPYRGETEQKQLGLKPNEGVEDVLRQRSGAHDDLNRLFVAMVKAAGIPAWLIRVPSRDQHTFEATFLTTSQFDAELAIVQLNDKEIFLDPGTKYCPYGLLDWRYSGLKGQRQIDKKGPTELVDTPLPDYKQARTVRVAKVQLTDQGQIEGTLTIGFYGIEALNLRQQGGKTDAEGRKKLITDAVKAWLPGNAEITLNNSPQWEATEQPLIGAFHIVSPLAVGAGKRMLADSHIFQLGEKPFFTAETRANPVYFDYPSQEADEVHLTIPPDLQIENMPANDEVRLPYALYHTEYKQESPNVVFSRRDFIMGSILVGPSDYKPLKDFFDKMVTGDQQQVILRGAAHAEVH